MDRVLVTTKYRGVFSGQLKSRSVLGDLTSGSEASQTVVLTECRNCLYWDSSVKGFLGLAVDGPGSGCRIGPPAVETELFAVTSITKMTQRASERWDSAPWK